MNRIADGLTTKDSPVLVGLRECPRTSIAHWVATLAEPKTCREKYTTTGEKRKTAPGPLQE